MLPSGSVDMEPSRARARPLGVALKAAVGATLAGGVVVPGAVTPTLSTRSVCGAVADFELYSSTWAPPAVCSAAVLFVAASCQVVGSMVPEAQTRARTDVVPAPTA